MPNHEIALIIDVETAGSLKQPLVYDIGLAAVVRTTGEILESHSLIVREVFFDMREAMLSAYYADKLPLYYKGIQRKEFRVVRFWTLWRLVRSLITKYDIHRIYAYHMAFDLRALNHTYRIVSGHWGYFFPKNIEPCCIWHMACQTILLQPTYRKFAYANGFVSSAGNIRTSAECAYAYITNNVNFSEAHTGMEDVQIEIAIMQKSLQQHKKTNNGIVHNPWQIPQIRRVA